MKIYRNILLVIVYILAVDGRSRVNSNSSTDIVPYNNGTVDHRSLSLPFNTSVTEPPPPKTQINYDENITDGGLFSFASFSLTIDNMYGSDTIQYSYGPSMYSSVFDASEQHMFNLMREASKEFWTPITDRFTKFFDDEINLFKQFGGGFSSNDYIAQGMYTDPNQDLILEDKKELSIHQLATVDIDNLSSTSEIDYSYNQSDDSHLFTAKQGFLIDKVTKRDRVLWDAKDYENVFCDKVYVATNESGQRVFRLFYPDEPPKSLRPEQPKAHEPKTVQLKAQELKPLQQSPQLKPVQQPSEIKHVQPKPPQLKPVQLKAQEPNPPRLKPVQQTQHLKHVQQSPGPKPVHLKPSEIKHVQQTQQLIPPQRKHVQQTPVTRPIQIKPPQLKALKQPSDLKPHQQPQQIKPHLKTVQQTQQLNHVQLPQPKPTTSTPITLDIRKMQTTNQIQYQYYDKERIHTFTPKQGFYIDTVVKGERQLWKSKDGIYPEKAIIFRDQEDKPVLRFQFPDQAVPSPNPKPRARVEIVRR